MRDEALDVATITNTSYEEGQPTTQVEGIGDGSSAHPGSTYHTFGFIGRPNDPDVSPDGEVGHGALALNWGEGNSRHHINLDDGRRTEKLPILPKGSSMQYADVDNAWAMFHGVTGGYELSVPAGQKAKIGGAKSLALGQALSDLKTALKVFATACKAAAVEPALGPAATALETAILAIVEIETLVTQGG